MRTWNSHLSCSFSGPYGKPSHVKALANSEALIESLLSRSKRWKTPEKWSNSLQVKPGSWMLTGRLNIKENFLVCWWSTSRKTCYIYSKYGNGSASFEMLKAKHPCGSPCLFLRLNKNWCKYVQVSFLSTLKFLSFQRSLEVQAKGRLLASGSDVGSSESHLGLGCEGPLCFFGDVSDPL